MEKEERKKGERREKERRKRERKRREKKREGGREGGKEGDIYINIYIYIYIYKYIYVILYYIIIVLGIMKQKQTRVQPGRRHTFLRWRWSCAFATPLCVLTLTLVLLAPFTKVEESFPLQAVYDIMYSVDTRLEILSYIRPNTKDNTRVSTLVNKETNNGIGDDEFEGFDDDVVVDNDNTTSIPTLRDFTISVPGIFSFSIKQKKRFDHEDFPGVVPRTFIPSLLIAIVSKPIVLVFDTILPIINWQVESFWSLMYNYNVTDTAIQTATTSIEVDKSNHDLGKLGINPTDITEMQIHERSGLEIQIITRCILAVFSIGSIVFLARSYAKRLGSSSAAIFLFMLAFQFHLPFYISRTLPNTFAAALIWISVSLWMKNSDLLSISVLAFTGLVVRCDTILVAIPIGILMVFVERIRIVSAIAVGVLASIASIASSVAIDSWFWGRWCWPEIEVLLFNTVQNRSGEWGTSPWHWYLSSALPRSLLLAYPLAPLGAYFERRVRPLFWVSCFYVVSYSLLPHKELRFMLPILPLLTACAAPAAVRIWHNRKKSYVGLLVAAAVYGGFLLCSIAIIFFASASIRNYPGGVAITSLHALHPLLSSKGNANSKEMATVHIDVLPAMTGVTQFLQRPDWRYSKQEGLALSDFRLENFTYLLHAERDIPGYVCAGLVKSYAGLQFHPGARDLAEVFMKMVPTVYIHERVQDDSESGGTQAQSRLRDTIIDYSNGLSYERFIDLCY